MKKRLLFLSVFYGIILYSHELCNQKILREIVCSHTGLLDCKDMYENPLDSKRLCGWQDAILNVKQFVENNSKKEKKYLLSCFAEIHTANQDLINGIKSIYAGNAQARLNLDTCRQFGDKFRAIAKKMRRIQNGLYWVASNYTMETQAIKSVQTLAQFVAVTANKALLNLH